MWNCGYLATVSLLIALVASGCASRSAEGLAAAFDQVKAGMALTEVERVLGPGEEITKEQLPANFAKVYTLEPTWSFRRWIRQVNQEKATMFVAVQDGKLTSARLVEKESTTTGSGGK